MNLAVAAQKSRTRRAPPGAAPLALRSCTRELDACVLRLPPGSCPNNPRNELLYLPLVRDQGHSWRPLVPTIQWMTAEGIVAHVCATRAVDTVDGRLVVAGVRNMTPERYLRHWRERIAFSLAIDQVHWTIGARQVARLEFDERAVGLAESHSPDPPADGLAGLLMRYRGAVARVSPARLDADGTCEQDEGHRLCLTVDLNTMHGAADAWWLQDYLRQGGRNPHILKAWIECLPRGPDGLWPPVPQSCQLACGAGVDPQCEPLRECAP